MKKTAKQISIVLLLLIIPWLGCFNPAQIEEEINSFPTLTGPYFGQSEPDHVPELFAPGIISTGMYNRDMAITPDGNEIYFSLASGKYALILFSKLEDGKWIEPVVAPFSGSREWLDFEPFITPDGNKFMFLSTRPKPGYEPKPGWSYQDIWVMDREGDHWGEPYNLGEPVNTEEPEYFPSVTKDGTLYFTRGKKATRESYIYRSKLVEGKYQEPEKLPAVINSMKMQYNAFISPDEDYLILCVPDKEDAIGTTDYYISFRDEEDHWTELINMGEPINAKNSTASSPYISPDGKYFFFGSSRIVDTASGRLVYKNLLEAHNKPENGSSDIYWVSTGILESLRKKAGE